MPNNPLPSFWVTKIAKALSGDQPCQLSTWLSGRPYEKRPDENAANLATWKTNHTVQLNDAVARYKDQGWKCDVERFFKVTGSTAIISGKVDLVAQQPEKRPLIIDVKSGQPRDTDIIQVAIEMILIPLAWNVTMTFDGLVIYSTHEVPVTPTHAADLKPKLFSLLKHLGLARRPDAAPSESACKFCPVGASDCSERFNGSGSIVTEASTALF